MMKITVTLVLALLFFGIGTYSFYRAGDALYTVLDCGKGWGKVCGWAGLGYLGAGLPVGIAAYWLSICTSC